MLNKTLLNDNNNNQIITEEITITSGVMKFNKRLVIKAMIHNHRAENSHRNIINNNTCYFLNDDNVVEEVPKWANKDNVRKRLRNKSYNLYKKHHNRQFKLLSERAERLGITPPKEKDLRPIVEGVVNFGNVYDIKNATEDERKAKTKAFNQSWTEEDLIILTELISKNLKEWAREFNLEILDVSLHTDEEGLIHAHYLTTHYDSETGMAAGIRNNKNNIGWRLQEIIAKGIDYFNNDSYSFKQTEGKNNRRKSMTKEELKEFRKEHTEIEEIKKEKDNLIIEKEQIENDKRELEYQLTLAKMEVDRIAMDLENMVNRLQDLDPNDKNDVKKKINTITASSDYNIGKGRMKGAIQAVNNLKKLSKALEKRYGINNSIVHQSKTKPTSPEE